MKLYFEEGGKIYGIDVMFHPSERTFEEFCDFRNAEALFFEQTQKARKAKTEEERDKRNRQAVMLLAEAMGHMVKGDLHEVPVSCQQDGSTKFEEYFIRPGDELSLYRLYAHTVNTVNQYRPEGIPERFSIRIGKKKYYLSRGAVNIMAGQNHTVGESLEVMEYQRRANGIIQEKPKEAGSIEFNLGLTELAILMREKGVELPAKEAERREYIEQQKEVFKDAALADVLALRFFLGNTLLKTNRSRSIRTFGKRRPARSRAGKRRRSRLLPRKR